MEFVMYSVIVLSVGLIKEIVNVYTNAVSCRETEYAIRCVIRQIVVMMEMSVSVAKDVISHILEMDFVMNLVILKTVNLTKEIVNIHHTATITVK
mmetsp:Transcript_19342/g.3147  ORF Transcript_19342/g.3147 Transcript_19342/m.3147 type:complete len:95 (-) Transcript_19342:290-574(-)